MHVDTLTLMIPGSFAAALASIFLFGAWVQTRTALSLLWWAVGSLAASLGVALLIAGLATGQSLGIATGVGISTVAPALFWGGIRQFNRRRVPVFALLAGIVAWGAAGPLAQLFGHEPGTWSTLVSFSTWCIYLPASAWELTRARREKLNALWPMIGVLILHSLVYLGGSHDLITGELVLGNPPRLFSWFGAIHFESIVFAMASATLMILLNKERVE
ncbi:MAG TPA: hypothetical protein VG942_06735, partial [Hyphomonadaceae bacterium]|nr:hypothetical protein [Hyphomonadaceae bacterium]